MQAFECWEGWDDGKNEYFVALSFPIFQCFFFIKTLICLSFVVFTMFRKIVTLDLLTLMFNR